MAKVKHLIEELKRMNPDDNIAWDLWTADDVLEQADDREVTLEDWQVVYILDKINDVDSEQGINWYVVDAAIDAAKEIYVERKSYAKERKS